MTSPTPSDPTGPVDPEHVDPEHGDPEHSVPALRADVADAAAALQGLSERPVAEHVAVFERLHAVLGDALSAGSERA